MALAARSIFCGLKAQKLETGSSRQAQKPRVLPEGLQTTSFDNGKIVLQPRLCTLRSYGSDPIGLMIKNRSSTKGGEDDEVSPFFATLTEYIDSSKKSQDFETISGRLAMIVFAATVTEEVVTGNSLFSKMDFQGIAEAVGACMAAVTCAAIFAWFSSSRNKVGRIFTAGCNSFIDSLIDQIVDGLFYDIDLSDWSDEI